MIEVNHLVKDYGPIRALDGVSFSVRRGEIVGLVGPNGAGKTTCMKILTGFIASTTGTASVDGLDIVHDGVQVRSLMGYLPENAPVYSDMTVREYLRFVARLRHLPPRSTEERIRDTARMVGLYERLDQETGTLSKGFRQRTGLAQALIHNPPVLILDEPTTGLDPNQIVEIRRLIRDIGRDRTVILSTHNLAEVTAVCNRIIIIHQGRIAADGTQEEIRVRHGGSHQVVVEFAGNPELPPDDQVLSVLGALEGCTGVLAQPAGSGRFLASAAEGVDLRQAIFEAAVSRSWKMVELHNERLDLETIFGRLTRPGFMEVGS